MPPRRRRWPLVAKPRVHGEKWPWGQPRWRWIWDCPCGAHGGTDMWDLSMDNMLRHVNRYCKLNPDRRL